MSDTFSAELRFSMIPEWVIDAGISDKAIRLFVVLARYADNQTHQAFPSRETLAERMTCSVSSVDRATEELITIGALTKKQRHNSSLIYTLRFSRGIVTDDEGGSSPVMRGSITHDDLTITTELEPENYIFKTAKSLPHNFTPSETIQETFQDKYPGLTYEETLEAFIDHHTAKGSRFKDWDAAFRTWCRNAQRWSAPKTVIHKQELKPAAEGPGRRDWVKQMHDLGEHFECKPGEFDCK